MLALLVSVAAFSSAVTAETECVWVDESSWLDSERDCRCIPLDDPCFDQWVGGCKLQPECQDGAKLPLPETAYDKTAVCPFSQWYPKEKLSSRLGAWVDSKMMQYFSGWKKTQAPASWNNDDHDFTELGQGNTLGFVTAKLSIDPSQLPPTARAGLFGLRKDYPAVVRFSDFGMNGLKLARAAVKIPFSGSWADEVNLLFTESLPVFPIADNKDLAVFIRDWTVGIFQAAWSGTMMAETLAWWSPNVAMGALQELVGKSYFSQLPYKLGKDYAMKFQLVPRASNSGKGDTASGQDWVEKRRKRLDQYLKDNDAVFDLQLKVRRLDSSTKDSIMKKASTAWPETPITVGTLTIPSQRLDSSTALDAATNKDLRRAVARHFGLSGQTEANSEPKEMAIHKMFPFHPIMTAESNKPIGDVNEFRSNFYAHHEILRGQTTQRGLQKPLSKMPFDKLIQQGVFPFVQSAVARSVGARLENSIAELPTMKDLVGNQNSGSSQGGQFEEKLGEVVQELGEVIGELATVLSNEFEDQMKELKGANENEVVTVRSRDERKWWQELFRTDRN